MTCNRKQGFGSVMECLPSVQAQPSPELRGKISFVTLQSVNVSNNDRHAYSQHYFLSRFLFNPAAGSCLPTSDVLLTLTLLLALSVSHRRLNHFWRHSLPADRSIMKCLGEEPQPLLNQFLAPQFPQHKVKGMALGACGCVVALCPARWAAPSGRPQKLPPGSLPLGVCKEGVAALLS